MRTNEEFILGEMYNCLRTLDARFPETYSITLGGNNCGYLDHEDMGRIVSWNTLEDGRKYLIHFAQCTLNGMSYDEYLDDWELKFPEDAAVEW